jgi:hypothetical protein
MTIKWHARNVLILVAESTYWQESQGTTNMAIYSRYFGFSFSCAWCAFQISCLWWGFLEMSSLFVPILFLCCDNFSNPKHINVPSTYFLFYARYFGGWVVKVSIVTNYQVLHVTCMMNYVECPVFWMCDELLSTCLENIWVEMGWSFLWHQNQVLLTTTKMNPSECRWVDLCCWHCSLQTFRREDCTCMNAWMHL